MMRLPAPLTIVLLVAAVCAALLESSTGVSIFIGVATLLEVIIFALYSFADGDGLG